MLLLVSLMTGLVEANPEKTFILPGGAEIEMVWIEPGTFTMGTTEQQEQWLQSKGMWGDGYKTSEQPAHQVSISRGFYLGKSEIAQAQWESVMGTLPWEGGGGVQEGPNYPAVYISWNDVQEFIARLNEAEGSEVYRLPPEAEWDYACRPGTTTLWSFGDDESLVGEYAWYTLNAYRAGEGYGHEVGTKLPNPWGLYDMHGKVWEWCQDWYGAYSSAAQTDPRGLLSGSFRVVRGGCNSDNATWVRSAARYRNPPDARYDFLGVRLLRTGPAPSPTTVPPASWGEIKAKLHR